MSLYTASRKDAATSKLELLNYLKNPTINLEEAAVLLEVCPTTVRRYTNKGVLKCLRTAGGHRRFLLNDILELDAINHKNKRTNKLLNNSYICNEQETK